MIWVYGVGDDNVEAFIDLGLTNLIELVRFYRRAQAAHALATRMIQQPAAYAGCLQCNPLDPDFNNSKNVFRRRAIANALHVCGMIFGPRWRRALSHIHPTATECY